MKVLITGGAGFIGSHTADRLIEEGNEVIVVDNLSTGKMGNVNQKATFYKEDIRDEAIFSIFAREKPECVLHLASQVDPRKSLESPVYDSQININGTINLLECCIKNNVKKIVYSSSIAIYGNPRKLPICEGDDKSPINQYGLSKLVAESYIKIYNRLYGIEYMILRYSNVYGEREKVETGAIPIFINKLLSKEIPIIYNEGTETRDYIYVKDVVDANIKSIFTVKDEELNIGSERELKTLELFNIISSMIDVRTEGKTERKKKGNIQHIILNTNKAKKLLGWTPNYSIVDGLINTIDFHKGLGL